ncbi:COX3 oxidase, partial [Acromyrmex insinuator]
MKVSGFDRIETLSRDNYDTWKLQFMLLYSLPPFTASSYVRFCFSLSFRLWVRLILFRIINYLNNLTHHFLINKDIKEKKSFLIIITLGIYFLILQLIKYINISFTIADSIYDSTFFLHFSSYHHFGFEAAS